ncbi:MAG: double-strand break repair helicase AddA [Proteobacteria bacterium]|nr:double-strand break repair helicase AddA [Pseudomonadota bacterium]
MVKFRDADAAQRPAANPGLSLWVAASAGTGKTKVLTDRVLALLLNGTRPERILCLTFTKAAAAEMANRVHQRLGEWARSDDFSLARSLEGLTGAPADDEGMSRARRLFTDVLDVPGGMRIQTIHAFCQSLLRRFPVEADIAPHFEVMDERTAAEVLEAARNDVLNSARQAAGLRSAEADLRTAKAGEGADAALAGALAEATAHVHEDEFTDLMANLAKERGRLRRLIEGAGGVEKAIAAVYGALGATPGEDAGTINAEASADGAFDGDALRTAADALNEGSAGDRERARVIGNWLGDTASRVDTFDDYQRAYLTADGARRKTLMTQMAAAAAPPGAVAALNAEAERLIGVAEDRKKAIVAAATAAALSLGAGLLNAYRRQKSRRALLDYDDLILMTRDLLRQTDKAPWVLFKLDGGLDHILIDEAQDTNPEQWEVIAALAEEFFAGLGAREEMRTVFAVGDAKQSIYSFQRADPAAFEAMRARFRAHVEAAGKRWRNLDLDISFRSTTAVLSAIDAIFSHQGASDGVGPPGPVIEHIANRSGHAGIVELWPPAEPGEADETEPWQAAVTPERIASPRARTARLIARTIRDWIDRGERLQSKDRPVGPGDIMVLVRQRTGFVEELVRALKQLSVPVAGIDRMVLTDQLPVMDLIALGRFLLLAEDDLTLATVLKGPLIGLDEEQLFTLAHGRGEASLWEVLKLKAREAADGDFARAQTYLAGLLARVDYSRPYELFAEVLNAKGGRRKLLRRLGPDADDPLNEFLALALAYERVAAPSLQGFLHWVEAGEAEIKRDLEQGTRNEVRVMTVHGAKGLQAPIVFLPDTMQAPVSSPRLLWLERPDGAPGLPLWAPRRGHEDALARSLRADANLLRDQEYRRLLYVALTRAEDRLYICGWRQAKTPPEGCWYNLVKAGLEDIAEKVEFDFSLLAGDQDGEWKGPGLRIATVQGAEPELEDDRADAGAGASELPSWARAEAPDEPAPPTPLTPSRSGVENAEPAVRSPLGPDDGAGFARGRIIHRLLQTLPALAPDARAIACRRYLARPVLALGEDAQAQIAAETLGVLDDPEFQALFGQDSLAEVSVVGEVNGHALAGQIDRLVVTGDTVLIVDYKTNRLPPGKVSATPEIYLRQMAAYRAVIAGIYPRHAVRCALLWTDGPSLMMLDDGLLDGYAP